MQEEVVEPPQPSSSPVAHRTRSKITPGPSQEVQKKVVEFPGNDGGEGEVVSPVDIQLAPPVAAASNDPEVDLLESIVPNNAAATPHVKSPKLDALVNSPGDTTETELTAKQLFAPAAVDGEDDLGDDMENLNICASTGEDTSNQCDCFDNPPPDCQANYKEPLSPLEIVQNAGLENDFKAKLPALSEVITIFHCKEYMFSYIDGDDEDGHDVISQFLAKSSQESDNVLSGGEPDYSDSSLYLNMKETDKVPPIYLVLGIPSGGYRQARTQLFERASVNEAMEIRSAYGEMYHEENKNTPKSRPNIRMRDVAELALTDIVDAGILPVYVEKMQNGIYKYKVITTNDETREEKAMGIFVKWMENWKEYTTFKEARDAKNSETTKSFFTNVLNTKATNTIGYASAEVQAKVLEWANNGGDWKTIFPDGSPPSQDTTAVNSSSTQGCDEPDATSRSDDRSESSEEDKTVTVELLNKLGDFKSDKEFVAEIIKIVGDSSEEDKLKRRGLTTMKQVPGNSERRDRNIHQRIAFLVVKYAVLLQCFDSLEQIFSDDPTTDICSIETLVDVVLFFTNIPKKFWYSQAWDTGVADRSMTMTQLLGWSTVNILTILQIQCVDCHRCVVDSPDFYHISSFENDHWLKFFEKEFNYSKVHSNKLTLWKEYGIKGYVRAGLFELLKAVGIKCGFDHYRGRNEPDDWDKRCRQQPTANYTSLAEKAFPGTNTGLTFEEIFSLWEVAAIILMWDDLGAFRYNQVFKFTLQDLNIPVANLIGMPVFDLTYLRTDDQLRNLTPTRQRRNEVTKMLDVLCAKISGTCFSPDCNECFLHLSPSSKSGIDWHHVLSRMKTNRMSDLRSNSTVQEWYKEGIRGGCRQGCRGCHARVTAVTNGYLELDWCDETGAMLYRI